MFKYGASTLDATSSDIKQVRSIILRGCANWRMLIVTAL
jgi:hypothetical protein